MRRRSLLSAACLLSFDFAVPVAFAQSREPASPEALLRAGGIVVAMRHALAPGTFDPPGFRAGDCSTQRNLSDEGRAQARRIGAWYSERGLVPTAVRSSAWCRCLETARLAFGAAERWAPLDSLSGGRGGERSGERGNERSNESAQMAAMRAALARRAETQAAGFEVWVTHQFNLTALLGGSVRSGEGLVLRHDRASGEPRLLATLTIE